MTTPGEVEHERDDMTTPGEVEHERDDMTTPWHANPKVLARVKLQQGILTF